MITKNPFPHRRWLYVSFWMTHLTLNLFLPRDWIQFQNTKHHKLPLDIPWSGSSIYDTDDQPGLGSSSRQMCIYYDIPNWNPLVVLRANLLRAPNTSNNSKRHHIANVTTSTKQQSGSLDSTHFWRVEKWTDASLGWEKLSYWCNQILLIVFVHQVHLYWFKKLSSVGSSFSWRSGQLNVLQ